MPRILDLNGLLPPAANMQVLNDTFERGFRRRPEYLQGQWTFSEPAGGIQPNSLLTIGQAIPLEENEYGDIARRISSFLSTEFDRDRPPIPKLHISDGYGLISKLEELHLKVFFADRKSELVPRLERDLLPFMVKEFGVTHVCVVRPNYAATQSRLSLLKIFWATQAFGLQSLQQKVMDERVLDSILPDSHEGTQWIEAFLTLAPVQLALPISLMGGHVVFFAAKAWMFPRVPVVGMLGNFTSSVGLATSEDNLMLQSVDFEGDTPERAHAYITMIVSIVNRLIDFATNPLNFLDGQQLKGLHQVQFVSALNLFMNDIRALNSTINPYERMSFCFSALDKLANIVATMSTHKVDEPSIFKAFFSVSSIRKLRRVVLDMKRDSHPAQYDLLVKLPKKLLEIQKSIRAQMRGSSTEAARLDWLWSYRNLRHGTFLRRNQFLELFVAARGVAPGKLAEATMALLIIFGIAPKAFLDVF